MENYWNDVYMHTLTKFNRRTTRQFNLQYVNNDNCGHNLYVVHILVSIEHLTQFLGILNIPWQFDVLPLRPVQMKSVELIDSKSKICM